MNDLEENEIVSRSTELRKRFRYHANVFQGNIRFISAQATGMNDLFCPNRGQQMLFYFTLWAMTSELMLLKLTASCEGREGALLHSDGNDAVRAFSD